MAVASLVPNCYYFTLFYYIATRAIFMLVAYSAIDSVAVFILSELVLCFDPAWNLIKLSSAVVWIWTGQGQRGEGQWQPAE